MMFHIFLTFSYFSSKSFASILSSGLFWKKKVINHKYEKSNAQCLHSSIVQLYSSLLIFIVLCTDEQCLK